MTLANKEEFTASGYRKTDTGVCILWAKEVTDEVDAMIYSLSRIDLEDSRPQTTESWAPDEQCEVQIFNLASLEQIHSIIKDSPVETIEAAEQWISENYRG